MSPNDNIAGMTRSADPVWTTADGGCRIGSLAPFLGSSREVRALAVLPIEQPFEDVVNSLRSHLTKIWRVENHVSVFLDRTARRARLNHDFAVHEELGIVQATLEWQGELRRHSTEVFIVDQRWLPRSVCVAIVSSPKANNYGLVLAVVAWGAWIVILLATKFFENGSQPMIAFGVVAAVLSAIFILAYVLLHWRDQVEWRRTRWAFDLVEYQFLAFVDAYFAEVATVRETGHSDGLNGDLDE